MNAVKPGVTPMMAQYLDIKAAHSDALLFYRMGDFYEMFFDDAVAAAEALDIALTKRGKHDGDDIPMCGVPVHSAEGYLHTLIRKGFRVAVCEQMEDPAEAKKRGSKAVVRREVVRLVTPGTLTEDSLLDARRNNYLAAYAVVRDKAALAWVDISTGAFRVMKLAPVRLGPEIARLAPSELVVAEPLEPDLRPLADEFGLPLTALSRAAFDSAAGAQKLARAFGVSALDGFGQFGRAELSAMGGLVDYLDTTQMGRLPRLRAPVVETTDRIVQIDAATRRNLELTHALSGGRAGSLLSVIDRTVTAAGARLLAQRLSSPSRDIDLIARRHDAIAELVADPAGRSALRDMMRRVPDLDRAVSRLCLDRGGPRDMAAVRAALEQGHRIREDLGERFTSDLLQGSIGDAARSGTLLEKLDAMLTAEPPLLVRDGGFVATGYDSDLDEVRKLRDEGRGVIAGLQASYAETSGVASLKIKHNNVLGYFIETPATHAAKMMAPPLSETFIHRQTTANAIRFTTVELSELETRILNAGSRAIEIEKGIFAQFRDVIVEAAPDLAAVANALAELDLAAALADIAAEDGWCRPSMSNDRVFRVSGGQHPVVEHALASAGDSPFVANDCDLSDNGEGRIWLLTGPNMSGKSTFLRQNAVIAVLAQMGSFVPAAEAEIGLVSQVFSRVGASDDLARGRSTFMVEMVETAAILNQADDRALVILDEIGRGTATYDGLSIAWATLEHLHDVNRCRALFATHYHELTALASRLQGVDNATVSVKEWEGEVIFLHEVRKGAADRSYGVQVAQLAGLPETVVSRARLVLDSLEKGEREGHRKPEDLLDDLPLFSATPPEPAAPAQRNDVMAERLAKIHPDDLTPREALQLLYELKDLSRDQLD